MSSPIESSNVSMGTTVEQSHSSPAVDRPISAIANFMKPVVSSATNSQVLVVRKSSAISSLVQSPTVSGSQLLTAGADAPKIVNVPIASLQNSGKIANIDGTTQFSIAKNAGVKVVWPQNMASGLLPVKQITPHNNSQNAQPIAVKRTVAPSLGNQVITKVIITNNNSNQAGTPVSVSANVSGTGSSLNTPQSLLLSSPSKTITLSRNIMNFAGTQQIVKTTTPTKQGVYLLSPVKPLSKITTVPSSLMKSPRRIAPATSTFSSMATSKLSTITGSVATSTPAITKTITVPQSPKKILLKTVAGNLSSVLASTPVTPSHVQSSGMGTQQLQGNNVHFVRLVSAPNSSTTNTTVANKRASFLPSTTTTTVVSSLPTITVTSQMCKTAALAKQAVKIKPAQKILIPAPTSSSSQGATSGSLAGAQMGQLPSGTLIPIVGSGQGYVVVPANYMTQAQQASRSVQNAPVLIQNILPAPTMSTSSSTISGVSQSGTATSANTSGNFLLTSATNQTISHHVSKYMNGRVPVETADSSRPRKPCNCTKSQCLKLYCDCFASGEFCNGCNCNNCYNNLTHEEERQKAIKSCLDRNRMAFHPKIGKSREGDTERRHTKGCHCKRSGCLKNYCECYEAKILCTDLCKCIGCKNFEDSYERKTLMHLADAVEVRVQQQAAAITNFTSDIFDGLPRPQLNLQRGNALPISFVNDEVIEATVACLLARAHQAEKQRKSEAETEKVLLEEFGLCLMSIISRSSQVEDMCSDVDSNS